MRTRGTGSLAAIPTALLLGVFAAASPAQEAQDQQPELGCDPSAIQWFIPGQFEEALARAKEEKRLLIIKGISFGVDDVGAKCATKGKW
jgi:hypothetical protein